MERIRSNRWHKLNKDSKYELFKSKTFKFLRNKNYFKFYLEYTYLHPQCENLSIRFKIRDIILPFYSKLQKIKSAIQYLSIITSLL